MSKVYITNKSGHNVQDALRYGDDIIYLTEGKVNIFRTDDLIEDLTEKLKDFTREDYLVFCGSSVVCALAQSIILTKLDSFNLLLFNFHNGEYIPRLIDKERLSLKEVIV